MGDHQRDHLQNGMLDTGVARAWLNSVTQSSKLCQYTLKKPYLGHSDKEDLYK